MDQRVSLVTLGVSDLARSRAFYEAVGWRSGADPGDDVIFFQAGGLIVALWDRGMLARDSGVEDRGGVGGGDACLQRGLPRGRGRRLDGGGRGRREDCTPRGRDVLGRLLGSVRRPRRPSVGGCPQPALDPSRGRVGCARALTGHCASFWGELLRLVETVTVALWCRRLPVPTRNFRHTDEKAFRLGSYLTASAAEHRR